MTADLSTSPSALGIDEGRRLLMELETLRDASVAAAEQAEAAASRVIAAREAAVSAANDARASADAAHCMSEECSLAAGRVTRANEDARCQADKIISALDIIVSSVSETRRSPVAASNDFEALIAELEQVKADGARECALIDGVINTARNDNPLQRPSDERYASLCLNASIGNATNDVLDASQFW